MESDGMSEASCSSEDSVRGVGVQCTFQYEALFL